MWAKGKYRFMKIFCNVGHYFYIDRNETNGTQRFVGFCIDILVDLADRLNFTYEIELVKDKTFGKKNDKGEWNGIIGELVNRVYNHLLL